MCLLVFIILNQMEHLHILANFYFNLGFNVTHISLDRKEYHKNLKTTFFHWDLKLKAPSHNWEIYYQRRQTLAELNSFNWKEATGLGVVLGFGKLRALDIDDCTDLILIDEILLKLKLPKNYEWVVRSGSKNGFHIIFYSNEHNYLTEPGKVKAFKPNQQNKNKFKHIELRWKGHLVLPPSIHPTFNKYEFINKSYPYMSPSFIEIKNVEEVINNYCKENKISLSLIGSEQETTKDPNDTSGTYIDTDEEETKASTNISATYDTDDERIEDSADTSGTYIDTRITHKKPLFLFFDTETTGLPRNWEAPLNDLNNWPRLVQLAFLLYDSNGNKISGGDFIIQPVGFIIPKEASNIHGITTEKANKEGKVLLSVLEEFQSLINQTDFLVAHNMSFDEKIIGAEFLRNRMLNSIANKKKICTMERTTNFCAIDGPYGYKWPKLSELHHKLFRTGFEEAHNASVDITATAKCFWELKKLGKI